MLKGEGVSKNFGGLMAVSNANFHVNQGEIAGLIGPNGAGKTTLFNLISGAVRPASGKIVFKDENITGLKPHRICRRGIARTFQSAKLFNGMTVFENVRLALMFGKSSSYSEKEVRNQVLQLLANVNLLAERSKLVKDLPVGSQKRVEIARALATRPELLLLDEVMAGLNPTELAQSMELIAKIRDMGITVFMIEHVMQAIMTICDRIMVFHNGTNLVEGTPQEVASDPTVIRIYLGE
ncbi:MAG: ABC transporter ATP-binding protein [Anaerolineae bacterium]|nr:ABC transporter ATP-binding protein [Anaerolineae bacterium]